jgi:hypothetical protein
MSQEINNGMIYCIMITSDQRQRFIPVGIRNFNMQSYKKKILIILNNSDTPGTLMTDHTKNNIFEFYVPKKSNGFTLGELRNIALEFVPKGALWTTWDDDDWRSTSYLESLYNYMKQSKVDIVFIKNRLEYNMNNGFMYRSEFKKAKMPFFLAKRVKGFKYLNKDSLEDIHVADDYNKLGYKIAMMNNDAKMYLRNIHSSNSSVYVDQEKRQILNYANTSHYHEHRVNDKEKTYIEYIISEYYKDKNVSKI